MTSVGLSVRLISLTSSRSVSLANMTVFISKADCERQWSMIPAQMQPEDVAFEWGHEHYYFVIDRNCPLQGMPKTEKILSKELVMEITNTSFAKLMGLAMQDLSLCRPAEFNQILNRCAS